MQILTMYQNLKTNWFLDINVKTISALQSNARRVFFTVRF